MDRKNLPALFLFGLGAVIAWNVASAPDDCKDGKCPAPAPKIDPKPAPAPAPKPKPKPKPWGPRTDPVGFTAFVGGPVGKDGTEIACDLPAEFHRKNTASKGLGLCVFTSIHHAAIWQNVPALQEFPKWLIAKNIPGGGYPGKVEKLIPQICADRGIPEPLWMQVEGLDLEILKLASRTGRMSSVTYSRSPTGRYGGKGISHMVSLVHADDKNFVVLDNNYIGADAYEWLTPEEFKKVYAPGWAVILLDPPPPPPPRNRKG